MEKLETIDNYYILAFAYRVYNAKREQLRIIIDKALNIHADCEYEALSKLINEIKQMLEEA